MKTGVHCSVRKGFVGALHEAQELGCTTFQMFTQSPRGWQTRVYVDEEFLNFRREREKLKIGPVVVHSPYLPNLCTSNQDLYERSVDSLIQDLQRCEKLGAEYLVVHPGAYSPESNPEKGIAYLVTAFNKAFERVPGRSMILIENMAGGGRRLGSRFREISDMINGIKDNKRVGVCFDTCHALAAGYDISSEQGISKTWSEFEKEIGLDRLKVFHVNDSKGPLGCHRDRHEHLGKGYVGLSGFKKLFNAHDFSSRAFILETPKEPMPSSDLKNLSALRASL